MPSGTDTAKPKLPWWRRHPIALAMLLVALSPTLLHYALRVHYPEPEPGAGVLISGASSGIGRSAALHLDSLGLTVFAGVRKQADAEALLEERPSLRPVLLDVTSDESVAAAIDTIVASGVPLTALVNNAGVSAGSPVEMETMSKVEFVYGVNVFGAFRLTKACLPLLRASGTGRVVNIGSLATHVATPRSAVYSGTKAALDRFGEALRLELRPWHMSVSAVDPAYVKTGIMGKQVGDNVPWKDAPMAERRLYAYILDRYDDVRAKIESHADSTDVTDEAIAHAVMSPYPETRYVVANFHAIPAWIVRRVVWLLPDRLRDAWIQ